MAHHKLVDEMDGDVLCVMAEVAVDRSGEQLEVFLGKHFVTDELLKYMGDRSPCLKGLGLISCWGVSNEGFTEYIVKSPLLEDLLLSLCPYVVGRDVYEAAGKACKLQRFALRKEFLGWCMHNQQRPIEEALRIAAMHELRHLRLIESGVTNEELVAIVDACPHLELLSLHRCHNIFADDALRATCAGIKELTLPRAPIRRHADSEFEDEFVATDCARDFDYGCD